MPIPTDFLLTRNGSVVFAVQEIIYPGNDGKILGWV